jgi:hypothetical protein
LTIPESAREGTYEIKASVIFTDGTNSKLQEFEVSNSGTGTVTAQNSTTINLNSGSNSGGTTLILGNPSTGSSGHALVLGNPAKTSAPKKSLFKINTLNLGVKEIPQKEDMPNVKVEFNGDTTNATSTSTWVLLAVILGLLIIVIFILIVILR